MLRGVDPSRILGNAAAENFIFAFTKKMIDLNFENFAGNDKNEDDEEEEVILQFPNLTLVSCISVTNNKTRKSESKKGYWGDVVSGPFIAYGFEHSNDIQVLS